MDIISRLIEYRYLLIFIGTIMEGPVLTAAVGFLIKLGYFDPVPAYFILVTGDLTSDVGYYAIGYFGLYRFISRFLYIGEELKMRISEAFRRHYAKVLFFSKITMGLGFAVAILITAGSLKIPLKKFIAINSLGGLIWTGVVLILGYSFGNAYLMVAKGQRIFFLVAVVVFFILLLRGLNRYFKERFKKKI